MTGIRITKRDCNRVQQQQQQQQQHYLVILDQNNDRQSLTRQQELFREDIEQSWHVSDNKFIFSHV